VGVLFPREADEFRELAGSIQRGHSRPCAALRVHLLRQQRGRRRQRAL